MVANPFIDFGGGTGVNVVLRRIVGKRAALLDSDQILRMHGVVFGLALWGDLVVRLGKDAIKRRNLRIETKRAKREYQGHEFSGGL